VGQHREADHPDREEVAEVLPPDHEAGQQQRRQATDDRPEQQLLAGIEAPTGGSFSSSLRSTSRMPRIHLPSSAVGRLSRHPQRQQRKATPWPGR
jgi:hypothetical protein